MRWLLSGLVLAYLAISPAAALTVTNDPGGNINNFIEKYRGIAASGERVVIDGYCGSSCTLFIGPVRNVCLTKRAFLGFHGSYTGTLFFKQEYPEGTQLMLAQYNPAIRAWLNRHGGLRTYKRMIYMRYPETASYFKICQ